MLATEHRAERKDIYFCSNLKGVVSQIWLCSLSLIPRRYRRSPAKHTMGYLVG